MTQSSEHSTADGWRFSATTSTISGAPQLLALARHLADPFTPGEAAVNPFCVHGATRSLRPCVCGSALVMGVRMHLPEATFGANRLTLEHAPSGIRIVFTADGALRSWARDSVLTDRNQVRAAPGEQAVWRSRVAVAQERSSHGVDWTFCCADYTGDQGVSTEPQATAAVTLSGLPGLAPPRVPKLANRETPWRPHHGPGLDMDLLRRREPILWSAEVPLYEDHLHDQGVSTLIARIRVMPSCFLVLLRHTLRIDGKLMQQREVRGARQLSLCQLSLCACALRVHPRHTYACAHAHAARLHAARLHAAHLHGAHACVVQVRLLHMHTCT